MTTVQSLIKMSPRAKAPTNSENKFEGPTPSFPINFQPYEYSVFLSFSLSLSPYCYTVETTRVPTCYQPAACSRLYSVHEVPARPAQKERKKHVRRKSRLRLSKNKKNRKPRKKLGSQPPVPTLNPTPFISSSVPSSGGISIRNEPRSKLVKSKHRLFLYQIRFANLTSFGSALEASAENLNLDRICPPASGGGDSSVVCGQ